MTSPRREQYAGAIVEHLWGSPDQVDDATTAVMGIADTELEHAEAAIARVRALHQPQPDGSGFPDGQQCHTCSQDGGDGYQYLVPWPCPTIRALDGEEQP